jgi:LEA14-like dessication related protein
MFRSFFVILVLSLGLSGCNIQDVDLVRVNNIFPENITGESPSVRVNVTLDNPNKFNIKVKKAKVNLTINGSDAGQIKLGDVVMIDKLKQGDYDVVLIADREKILSAIQSTGISAAISGKVIVNLKGWVKGKAFGLGKKIYIDEKKSISLRDLNLSN